MDLIKLTDNKPQMNTQMHSLSQDGVFIIRLVASHAGEMVAAELISELWSGFQISIDGQSFKKMSKTSGYINRCDDV